MLPGEIGPGFFIKAESAHRTEEGHYQLKNATVTTCCDGPRPGWMLFVGARRRRPAQAHDGEGFGFPAGKRAGVLHAVRRSSQRGPGALDRFSDPVDIHLDDERTSRPRILLLGDQPQRRRRHSPASISVHAGPQDRLTFARFPTPTSNIQVESLFAHDKLGQGGRSARILAYGDFAKGFSRCCGHESGQFVRVPAGLRRWSEYHFVPDYEHSLAFLSRNKPNASVNFLYARNGVFFHRPADCRSAGAPER